MPEEIKSLKELYNIVKLKGYNATLLDDILFIELKDKMIAITVVRDVFLVRYFNDKEKENYILRSLKTENVEALVHKNLSGLNAVRLE
ncbi:hypothetical protein [Sulfolobus acidocaldarius]|uniref:Uncharacterized protein n=3 Tax=Sulfolobus acidocaldarius TaxID=2285 RepID=Q4JBA9_SULAC|nr:hypothetical protein [Sulfolobus acidocaldarius]AAY79920.1 hypothetical protein Saci_0516 [Sulfolobus acidocaldarius DSM 639]WCM34473.1 hypothetical protein GO597_03510 [Sulfolobus acidocaldarius DSM 639]